MMCCVDFAPSATNVAVSGSGPPLRITVATYSAVLISMITTVVNRACGINPPSASDAARGRYARGATSVLQYGQILSSVVMNARQCGHIRRLSTGYIVTGTTLALRPAGTIKSAGAMKTEQQ